MQEKMLTFAAIRALSSMEEAVQTVSCFYDAEGCLVGPDSTWR